MIRIVKYPKKKDWATIIERPTLEANFIESHVRNILNRVKKSGDIAVREFNRQFDKVAIDELKVTEEEIKNAGVQVNEALKQAIKIAFDNISKFHGEQKPEGYKVETYPGVVCWRKPVAIPKVGIYVPGGTAPLFSTVLMLAIPAKIAGCDEIVLCTPPQSDGTINSTILYAAQLAGIDNIYKVGGAQAIAAMAYGTESITKVDKIFGPGNQFVTLAKQMVNMEGVAIDMPAGPSEVAIMTDAKSNPVYIAADLLSQAEHGKDSQVILVSKDEKLLDNVNIEIDKQLESLSRKNIAKVSLKSSIGILVRNDTEMLALINEYAPEHLIITNENADDLADQIINAGSVFVGQFTPEAAGDYASGTNHTLPTNGAARAFSGVSVESFMKQITFQKISKAGIKGLGPTIEILAAAENLDAHKNAVSVRLKDL